MMHIIEITRWCFWLSFSLFEQISNVLFWIDIHYTYIMYSVRRTRKKNQKRPPVISISVSMLKFMWLKTGNKHSKLLESKYAFFMQNSSKIMTKISNKIVFFFVWAIFILGIELQNLKILQIKMQHDRIIEKMEKTGRNYARIAEINLWRLRKHKTSIYYWIRCFTGEFANTEDWEKTLLIVKMMMKYKESEKKVNLMAPSIASLTTSSFICLGLRAHK